MVRTKPLLGLLPLLLCIVAGIVPARGGTYYSQTVSLPSAMQEKTTNLHFFFHDTLSGKDASAVRVARAEGSKELGSFGNVFAVDDPLTVGPELNSGTIGSAQGLYVSSGRSAASLVVYFDFEFTMGEFNGSSISVMSRNPVLNTERELAVVGGREKFRMARGFARLKTYSLDKATGNAIVEYNVTVYHY